MPRLRRVDPGLLGWARKRSGRGFRYVDQAGRAITRADDVQRIKDLVIPPAWTDVWISPDPMGHIQATGLDVAGRRQYLYHPRWRERRDQRKFEEMVDFARHLPEMRRQTDAHLRLRRLTRERVLACAVRLLDRGFFRVGGEAYTEANGSFGLATMRKEHVACRGGQVLFCYLGKSAKEHQVSVSDPAVCRVVRSLQRRRSGGDELLAYQEAGDWKDVRSADINDYLKEVGGSEFTAKMFRTWHGTVLAAVALAERNPGSSKTSRKRAVSAAVKDVAESLGNTPAVCRASYIDPRVIDAYQAGVTIKSTLEEVAGPSGVGELELQEAIEGAVLDLLDMGRAELRAAA